jgi:hypothetical protein
MGFNGILWETNHQGKMKGIKSIGTSCANNPHCIARRQNGESVCSKCYAMTYMKMRKSLQEHLEDNAKILANTLLEGREVPVTNELIYRFESFGDLYNATHLKNYVTIANHNPYTKFALWTKNIWILDEVFNKAGIKKPENLSIVVSSPLLNQPMKLDRERYWMVDHMFTVYEKDFIANNNIEINCGARSCLGCRKCYMDKDTFYINEQLK